MSSFLLVCRRPCAACGCGTGSVGVPASSSLRCCPPIAAVFRTGGSGSLPRTTTYSIRWSVRIRWMVRVLTLSICAACAGVKQLVFGFPASVSSETARRMYPAMFAICAIICGESGTFHRYHFHIQSFLFVSATKFGNKQKGL